MVDLVYDVNVQIDALASKLGASEAENARLNAVIQTMTRHIATRETELAKANREIASLKNKPVKIVAGRDDAKK